MGPLLPYLCLLGFVGLVFIIIIFFSARDGATFRTFFLQVVLQLSYVPRTCETG